MIKGVSEARRLPRLGHLRLGIKKSKMKDGQKIEYPAEVDYFVIDPKTPDPVRNEDLKKQFHNLYGEQPKAIKIMFPPVSPELFFQQWYKRYGSSTLVKCKGDGETATTTEDFAKGLEKIGEDERGFWIVKCAGPECPYQNGPKAECGRMAMLQVILPDLVGLGIWQINTGSYNSIVNINSAIDWLRGLCGRFAMIPVTLMRVPEDIPYEGKKSRHYILQIDQNNFSIGDIQRLALRPETKALISPADESKDSLFYDAVGSRPETAQIEDKTEPVEEDKPEDFEEEKEPESSATLSEEEKKNPTKESIKRHRAALEKENKEYLAKKADPLMIKRIFEQAEIAGMKSDDLFKLCVETFDGKQPNDLNGPEAERLESLMIIELEKMTRVRESRNSDGSTVYRCKKEGCGRTVPKGVDYCLKHGVEKGKKE